MTDQDTPIVFSHVNKAYDQTGSNYVVHDYSLTINKGEFFCLLGQSGCGKSTVLDMIAGIIQPTNGTLTKPDYLGMVFQSGALLPWLTVEDNVAFGPRLNKISKTKTAQLTKHFLEMVHLQDFTKRYPRELSGGQRQRVGIARAFATESEVLLMDEPFSALDPVITDELHADLLTIWQETHTTIVLVSHHFEEAVTLADRIGIMKNGTLEPILTVDIKRPRDPDSEQFIAVVKKIRDIMEG